MMTEDQRKQAIASLVEANRTKKPCLQLSTTFPSIEIADSYAISSAMADLKVASGSRLIGHKIGLTSKAMQASSQIDEPDYGHLFDDMLIQDGAKVRHADFCVPPTTLCRPSKSSMRACRIRERFSIPWPIMAPLRVWCSVGGRCGRRMWILGGWGPCSIEMAKS